jgi:hypothetical protein
MICLEAPSRVNPRVVTAACVTNATRYRALQRFLLSERNALTLWRGLRLSGLLSLLPLPFLEQLQIDDVCQRLVADVCFGCPWSPLW